MTRGENGHALREVLVDLEVRLVEYLTEWREQLGVDMSASWTLSSVA